MQERPTSGFQDPKQFLHRFLVLRYMFENMTTIDGVKGLVGKLNIRYIHAHHGPRVRQAGAQVIDLGGLGKGLGKPDLNTRADMKELDRSRTETWLPKQAGTVWLAKDSVLLIAVYIPLWGVGGLIWGVIMTLLTDGQLVKWLMGGILWGATCWFLMSIFLVIAYRQVTISVPVNDPATLAQRLSEAAKSLRYSIKQDSSASFVGTPRHLTARVFECNALDIRLVEESIEVTGPAFVVNKLRKKLQA